MRNYSDPRCRWCQTQTGTDPGWRASDPVIDLPSGVIVCSPTCTERPETASVWHRNDRPQLVARGSV